MESLSYNHSMDKIAENKAVREMLTYIVQHMATKGDLVVFGNELKRELRAELATKADLFALQTQINSIEVQVREMSQERLTDRIADLEEKVFGKSKR